MANNPKKGWKTEAAATGKAKSAERGWKQAAGPTAKTGPKLSKPVKLTLAVTALGCVLVGMILWFWPFRPIKPVRIVLMGAGYETNLLVPADALTRNSFRDLDTWARGDPERIEVKPAEFTSQGNPFLEPLKDCKAKTLILFVSALGGADGQGAFLVPQDADLKAKNAQQRLEKLFDQLKLLPRETRKLLILDTAQAPADWELGMVNNDFVRAFRQEPRLKEVENLVVLLASDDDQRSWQSEEWRRSIFAHYVVEGMKGAADLKTNGGDGDGRLTAQELSSYVQKHVKHWVRHNRDALQEPVLLDPSELAGSMELVFAGDGYQPPDAQKASEFAVPDELMKAWAQSQELTKTSPPPSLYAPQLWRVYLDTLLRAETLFRQGDTDNATRQLTSLGDFRERIRQAQRLDRDSYQNTLAAPAALGFSLNAKQDKELAQAFEQLWDDKAPPEAYKKKLGQMQSATEDRWQKQLLRIRLNALVLTRAGQDPGSLDTACRVLGAIDELTSPRPAEAHYAIMLKRDLGEKAPSNALIGKSLEVRLAAEQAALGAGPDDKGVPACAEQVRPWVREKVGTADQKRRLAQDLLFAADTRSWDDAGKLLDEASKLYEEAQTDAVAIRKALKARDDALAVLPYYTFWQAQQRTTDVDVEAILLPLWENVHALRRALDDPDPKPVSDKVKLAADRTDVVVKELARLRDIFDKRTEQTSPTQQQSWHEIQAALVVPFIAPDLRKQLLLKSREISAKLNVETDKATEVAGRTKEQNSEMAREQAQRQGRLALAMIGKDEFERQRPKLSFEDVQGYVKKPDEVQWWRSMQRAGEQIGQRLEQMPDDAEKLALDGRTSDLEVAAGQLRTASSLGHRLGGAAVLSWLTVDPVGENRRLQVHDLLCWQAERTFADYWAAEDQKQPYYRYAGLGFDRDALDLAGRAADYLSKEQKERRTARVRKIEEQLKAPDEVVVQWLDGGKFSTGPTAINLTDADRFERIYRLKAQPGVPEGTPVVWAKAGTGLKLEGGAGNRYPLDKVGPQRQEVQVPPVVVANTAGTGGAKTSLTLNGLYRGRRIQQVTDITLYQKPDLIVYQPELPKTARIAVQADQKLLEKYGTANAAIAIVLDCSGSMRAGRPADQRKFAPAEKGGPSRFEKALDALESVLRNLPDGITVSVRIFADEEDTKTNGLMSRVLRPPQKWEGKHLRPLMGDLRGLEPWGQTPLVRSIAQGKKDFPATFTGSKTIVCLTDGADSEFEKNKGPKERGAAISRFIENEFRETDIAVNVVGFEVAKDEQEAQQQFAAAIKKIGGNYFDAENSKQLVAALEKAILSMRFWIEAESGGLVPRDELPLEGADISLVGQNLRWIRGLIPGTYEVRVRTNKATDQRVRLGAGDSLILNLLPQQGGVGFQRDVYAESYYFQNFGRVLAKQKKKDWLLAVLQNQRTPEGAQLMTTLEKLPDGKGPAPKDSVLRVARPNFVWFRLGGADGKMPPDASLRVMPLYDYPAPAWSLDVTPWPRGTAVTLDAHWTEEDPPIAYNLRPEVDEFKSVLDLVNKEIAVPEQDERLRVTVESMRYEKRTVETRPGELKRDVDCLVVRLRYPVGKPFLAQLPTTLKPAGYEHRFYSQAGTYTGIFWNVTEEQARSLKTLDLISVEAAKERARKKTFAAEKLELGAPDTTDRPQKPRE